ncbi:MULTISPECIES: DEAD/DEAH box helicase [unclassified Arcicella]|uniref:DEAD/DEAH box helicase n=1 Tax=unclassified Arcicella TaxID=2644986 RepID=UPI0028599AF7|nr:MULTISPECIES: DEAD/DEAH box helicase [unclassified Arcicella]MDR6560803.1 ATP-dependent RNA helicase DeaD [Arcicella sp. BE51]MDR6810687.1 ATP-dependent RNA helicase DeaD [Arcicella sp. BE140]MDR6822037.1 ATP-dependent RNA helicase DeaD [Arcicella sp. BE139]
MATFKELGVSEHFIQAMTEMNINKPTEIQEKAIPYLLKNQNDFIGQAQTGTGKTAAFGLPLLMKVNPKSKEVQALILAPTRELCQQIAKHLFKLTKYAPEKIFVEAVYGGEKIDIQLRALSKPTQIIVATPGRLIDLLARKAVSLTAVRTLILDEADEMLSMGFKDELDSILRQIPHDGTKWLFSATLPSALQKLVDTYMSKNTHTVQVSKSEVVNNLIEHQFFVCDEREKFNYVLQFLNTMGASTGIIFCRTKAAVQTLTKQLVSKNIAVDAIHGDLQQSERDKVMRAFKNHKLKILVATDISARGIDVDDLAYVIHYQLPDQPEYYTHRSGRTARAGKRGISICFVSQSEVKRISEFSKLLNISFRKL